MAHELTHEEGTQRPENLSSSFSGVTSAKRSDFSDLDSLEDLEDRRLQVKLIKRFSEPEADIAVVKPARRNLEW